MSKFIKKILVARKVTEGEKVVIIDPKNENSKLAEMLGDYVIRVSDIESIFKKTHDIDKFIDEYREFIVWLNNKYPSFNEDIKKNYWIQRIIREHNEILMELRNIVKDEVEEDRYLIHNKEKINKICGNK